jgi:uncharacterized membrane protein
MMGFGFGGMFLFWGALVALLAGSVVLLSGLATGARVPVQTAGPTARQILDERLALGEITREEYALILDRMVR